MAEAEKDSKIQDDPLWYRDAIIYQLHVKAFSDSNGDGVGDFRGLTGKLDYIERLGVNTIWLLPFYPSPMRDDGYDIADYHRIHPSYGTRRDFRRLIREAHRRGIRVITELVINHTSDQHPWFQAARRAPAGSAKRNYYVWSDSDEKYAGTRIIFTDTETSNWAWDPVAQQYYWHRFFSHQPDLNFANPSVVRAVTRVMRYWLDMGVDGLRLDAIPYLCEREGTTNENLPETHAVVKQMRKVVDEAYTGRMFLGEANMWPEDVLDYFGDGDECHMAYHFPLMPRMYMALAQEDRHPIVEILEQTPAIPDGCQWAMFLRNHDELTLEMVTDEERDYMYRTYARDPRARINVGIRRRLAPLLGNDAEKIKLLTGLLLSMPGSPILYYGDEIGMGDNIYLGDRNGVRTPMQWSPDRNAGFSKADPQQLYLPPVMDPVYGYEAVNVEAQSRDVSSLLNWTRRIISVRKSTRAFGRGRLTLLGPGNRHVFAYLREYEDETILCVANLAGNAQPVELDLSRFKGRVPVEMMGRSSFPPIGELPYFLTLPGHGFFWFRLASEANIPEWHSEGTPGERLVTLVLSEDWESFFPENLPPERQRISQNMLRRYRGAALPGYLGRCRWFTPDVEVREEVEIERRALWEVGDDTFLLNWIRTGARDGKARIVFLPLALTWGGDQDESVRQLLNGAVARVRERARTGVLYDALRNSGFCRAMIETIRSGESHDLGGFGMVGTPTCKADALLPEKTDSCEYRPLPAGRRHTSVAVDDRIVLKLLHEADGSSSEQEIARFLTEHTEFDAFPRLAGDLSLAGGDDAAVLALALEYRRNQGDAWHYACHHLDRFLDEARLRPRAEIEEELDALHADCLAIFEMMGRRVGELHLALSADHGQDAFKALPIDGEGLQDVQTGLRDTLPKIMQAIDSASLGAEDMAVADEFREAAEHIETVVDSFSFGGFAGLKCRIHGGLELSRVLIAESDIVITDFTRDEYLELDQRASPLSDIAEFLRSVDRCVLLTLKDFGELSPGDRTILQAFAADWRERAGSALLAGYFGVTGDSELFGRNEQTAREVIQLFLLQKLFTEILAERSEREAVDVEAMRGVLAFIRGMP